jgi:hypothetical protein
VNTKIGRNDLCSCGSGKKYKKCCIAVNDIVVTSNNIADFEYNKIRKLDDKLNNEILITTMEYYKADANIVLASAWNEFHCFEDFAPELDVESPVFYCAFLPWFVYNWVDDIPDRDGFPVLPEETPAKYFLAKNKAINQYEKDFIIANLSVYFSLYVVKEIKPGSGMIVKDILRDNEITVKDYSASQCLQIGHVILARVLSVHNQNIMVGTLPFTLQPKDHLRILDFKDGILKRLKLPSFTDEMVMECEFQTRNIFLNLLQSYISPTLPELRNTDGDPILFCKVHFVLKCSPHEAIENIYDLALADNPTSLLESEEAILDKNGSLKKIQFPWLKKGNKKHKSWGNTILGHIKIEKNELSIEVNSDKRSKKARKEIEKRLGQNVTYSATKIETPEKALKSHTANQSRRKPSKPSIPTEEQKKIIAEFSRKHWIEWLDSPIPALNNKTPRQASKSKNGRERLNILLQDFELRAERQNPVNSEVEVDVDMLRRELNLLGSE